MHRAIPFRCLRVPARGRGETRSRSDGADGERTSMESARWRERDICKTSSNSCSPGISAQRRSATRHGEHHRDAATPWRFGSCLPSSSRCCAALRCPLGIVGIRQRRTREDAKPVNNVPRYSGTLNQIELRVYGRKKPRKFACIIWIFILRINWIYIN